MAAEHGKKGKVVVASATIASIKKWKFDAQRSEHDTTAFADSALPNRSFIPGLVGRTGSIDGDWDMTDTNGQVTLINSMTSDTLLALKLYTNDVHYWAVSAFITKFAGDSSIDNLENCTFDFRISGAATFT